MVTLPLEKMATRVAGSLCLATGLGDEMIVSRYAFFMGNLHSLAAVQVFHKMMSLSSTVFKEPLSLCKILVSEGFVLVLSPDASVVRIHECNNFPFLF